MTTTDGVNRVIMVWDLPTRLFHWLLVLSFVAAYVTAQLGPAWMDWHFRAGYLLAALLLFRLAWGVVGSDSARFRQFLRGPRSVYQYLRGDEAGIPHPGHNPAGGWMVVIMLITLTVISVTGFFADDLILFSGTLAACVSGDVVDTSTRLHLQASNVALGLIALHLLAIGFYAFWRRRPLISAMVTGQRPAAQPNHLLRFVHPVWALVIFSACAAGCWMLAVWSICG
jgi:cytochrome b